MRITSAVCASALVLSSLLGACGQRDSATGTSPSGATGTSPSGGTGTSPSGGTGTAPSGGTGTSPSGGTGAGTATTPPTPSASAASR